MSNDQLISLDQLSNNQLATTNDFDDVISSSSYLPRLQLFGANSEAVKEEKIGQGRFGVVRTKDDVEDLGKNVDCLPLGWRLKAMQIGGEDIITVFDHTSAEFKRIQAESEEQDSGAMYGVEFLLWLPELGMFVTYYLNSKSSRREAKPLRALLGKASTIESQLVKTKKYSWHAPKVKTNSTPITNLPDAGEMKEELTKFNNPQSSEAEGTTKEEKAAVSNDRR